MIRTHLIRRPATAVAALAVTALALAACSGGSLSGSPAADTGGGEAEGLIPVTVGAPPIASSAAIQQGIDDGIFEKHGLDVTMQSGQGGAALLPAVSSGSIEFAIGNPLSVLVAASQGLEMKVIAGYSAITDLASSGIVVMDDSGIESWADLEGKTVALNAVNTQGDLTTMALVEADGGDPTAVSFTEIPFADQLAQLEQGHIDASWIAEPSLTASLETEGVRWLGDPQAAIDGLYTMVTFTSGAYADSHPEVVDAFVAAISESVDLTTADEPRFRESVAKFTGIDPAAIEKIRLEKLSGNLDLNIITDLSSMALKYGFLDSEPDLGQVVRD